MIILCIKSGPYNVIKNK